MIHSIESSPETFVDVYSSLQAPKVVAASGDNVVAYTLDSSGKLSPQKHPELPQPKVISASREHCLAGAIKVGGTVLGRILAITCKPFKPDEWGLTIAGGRENELYRLLAVESAERAWLYSQIDANAGYAQNQHGHRAMLGSFPDVVGLGLPGGDHSTMPLCSFEGGNLDSRESTGEATMYLPLEVASAMLCLTAGPGIEGAHNR